MPSLTARRAFVTGSLGVLLLGLTACGTSGSSGSVAVPTSASSSDAAAASTGDGSDVPDLQTLVSQVQGQFQQFVYEDSTTGQSLPYNLYLPDGYDPSESYPLVLYIADSSLVGQDVTAPLSQYGALTWAAPSEQAKRQSIVLVPEYPSVIIDDHGSYTTTDYVEMTTRLVAAVSDEYGVDPERVYGTGQSMGCMTVMYLAAQHPDLFAAELLVSGQWDVTELAGLAQQKFFYIAAGGDEKASAGQAEVEQMLTDAGVPFSTATWDATWTSEQFATAADELLSAGHDINVATFAAGTVLEASGSTGSSAMGGEHMASFEPAYKIAALRDWLFEQTA